MTYENYEKAGVLLNKIESSQILIDLINKNFTSECVTSQQDIDITIIPEKISKSIKLLVPELIEHLTSIKKEVEFEFANLK